MQATVFIAEDFFCSCMLCYSYIHGLLLAKIYDEVLPVKMKFAGKF